MTRLYFFATVSLLVTVKSASLIGNILLMKHHFVLIFKYQCSEYCSSKSFFFLVEALLQVCFNEAWYGRGSQLTETSTEWKFSRLGHVSEPIEVSVERRASAGGK